MLSRKVDCDVGCYSPKPEVPGPSPGEWSPIRGISAYRFWDIAIENVIVKMSSYLMDGNQPPLIIALECEIEKGGPRSPLSKGKF